MKKILISISIILFVLLGAAYFYVNSVIGGQKIDMTKTIFTLEQRIFIKKYFFPHKYYSQKIKTLNLQKEQHNTYLSCNPPVQTYLLEAQANECLLYLPKKYIHNLDLAFVKVL